MLLKRLILSGTAVLALAGCSGNTPSAADPVRSAAATGTPSYTSDQLRQALLEEIPGYVRAGEPDSGAYGMLKAVRNFAQLQGQVTVDKPKCAGTTQTFGTTGALASAPAALTTFARADGQTVTETLVTLGGAAATEEIQRRVPALCRTFRTRSGDQWSTHQVVEATPDRHLIGEGSRTVGVVTMSGNVKVTMWFVVFKTNGYLATISVYGQKATRQEAEQLARSAYQQALAILP